MIPCPVSSLLILLFPYSPSSLTHIVTYLDHYLPTVVDGRNRREMKVRELVWSESVAVQVHVTRLLQKDLTDLGIHLRPSGIGK